MFKVGDILEVSERHTYLYPKCKDYVYEGPVFQGVHSISATNGAIRCDGVLTRTLDKFFKLKEAISLENK